MSSTGDAIESFVMSEHNDIISPSLECNVTSNSFAVRSSNFIGCVVHLASPFGSNLLCLISRRIRLSVFLVFSLLRYSTSTRFVAHSSSDCSLSIRDAYFLEVARSVSLFSRRNSTAKFAVTKLSRFRRTD